MSSPPPGDEFFPHYCLEMDVDDNYPLYCYVDEEGSLHYDNTFKFSVNSKYAEIISQPGCADGLVALTDIQLQFIHVDKKYVLTIALIILCLIQAAVG